MGSAPDIRIRVKQTPEGPAFYPFGWWGGGTIVDARAERRLAVWSRRRNWVQVGVCMVFIPDYMPGNLGLRFAAYMLAVTAVQHLGYWACVRHGRRTDVRLSAAESLHMQAEAFGHGMVGVWAFLLALAAGFVVWRSFFAPYAHWGAVTAAIDLALCAYAAVYLVRVGAEKRRQDRKPSSAPGLWMRRR